MAFKLEKRAKKGTCPYCGKRGKWRFFEGYHGDYRYGVCDRINHCPTKGEIFYPDGREKKMIQREKVVRKKLHLDKDSCLKYIENQTSNLHKFLMSLGISSEHLKRWSLGTGTGGTTEFYFCNKDGVYVNKKTGRYNTDGHRNKDFGFYSMSPRDDYSYYPLCLYGENLMTNKEVWVVESEKSAIIASWFYPEFDWVSCGSASGLSDGSDDTNDKITPLKKKKVVWLCDADSAGRNNSSIKNLEKHKIRFRIVDLFTTRKDGYDIADDIVERIKKGEKLLKLK